MYGTYVLTIADLKMFLRNKAALFFSLFVPLMIMLIFGAMRFDRQSPMDVGLVTHAPNAATAAMIEQLRKVPALTIHDGALEEERQALKDGKRIAVLDVPDDLLAPGSSKLATLTVYVDKSHPLESDTALAFVHQMADKATVAASGVKPIFNIEEQSVGVRSLRYIEFLLPGIIAMSVMQMSVFSVAFVFAQYREKGILKRVLATPVRPSQFVASNIIARLGISLAQSVLFIVLGLVLFDVRVQGAYWLLGLCVLLGSLMFLGLGFTISGLARTMETVPLLANLIVFPMLFLGNVFFPASSMPHWLEPIAGNLPLTYFANALRAVMTEGATLYQVKWNLLAVLLWAAGLIGLAMFTFRLQEREG
jgi:ABC-2 type transport system permease protein